MGMQDVRRWVAEAGRDPDEFGWDDRVEHRWTLRPGGPEGAEVLLGGFDHGEWRTWLRSPATREGVADLVEALRRLDDVTTPAPIPRTVEETSAAAARAVQLMHHAASAASAASATSAASGLSTGSGVEVLPASGAKVGTPLDHVGGVSGHVLHPYGTAWEQRGLPEVDRLLPVRGYLLVHVLPVGCRVERVAVGSERPGGAWRVVLDRSIAELVASGGLRPFVPHDQ